MLLTIVTFFLVLGVIVIIHELGHFFVARKNKVKVDEFGLGIPPRIIGMYKNEAGKWKIAGPKTKDTPNMIWSLNWIPLGGFVKIKGEQGEASQDPDSFAHKSIGVRAAILSAGVTMNIVLAMVLLAIGFMIGVPQVVSDDASPSGRMLIESPQIRVMQVLPNSPADGQLEFGDTIVRLDDRAFANIAEVQAYMDASIGKSVLFTIERDGQTLTTEIVPQVLSETERGGVGVALVKTAIVSYPWYRAIWEGIKETGLMMFGVIFGFFLLLKNLIFDQQLMGEVYGPVGIASLVGDAARMGFLYVLQMTATLSVIIAVINYLPFPALDGGRVLFLIIEKLRGKPVDAKVEAIMHNIGFALLMLLVIIVTFKDIARIFA